MSELIRRRSEYHKVEHEYSGKMHFFKVTSNKGEEYSVSIKVNCTCRFMGVKGQANGKICSHILAVLRQIVIAGQINISEGGMHVQGNETE